MQRSTSGASLAIEALPALGSRFVRPGRLLVEPGRVPTGLPVVDALLGGGFPRGRLSEVVGTRSSGRTTVLLHTLARATARGELGALVDVTDGLDPASARAVGVALDRLLWVRGAGSVLTGLRAADVLLRGGGFGVVAVDLGEVAPEALVQLPPAALVRLQRVVEPTPTVLLLGGPRRVAGSLAAVVLALTPRRVLVTPGGPGLLTGLAVEARLVRAWHGRPGTAVSLAWHLGP